MHPNLAKHLHSEACVELIKQYEECNAQNKYVKYFGVCTDLQNKMTACIQKQLVARRNYGTEHKREKQKEEYMKRNPEFEAKVKLLEELREKAKQQEKAQESK